MTPTYRLCRLLDIRDAIASANWLCTTFCFDFDRSKDYNRVFGQKRKTSFRTLPNSLEDACRITPSSSRQLCERLEGQSSANNQLNVDRFPETGLGEC